MKNGSGLASSIFVKLEGDFSEEMECYSLFLGNDLSVPEYRRYGSTNILSIASY
jgi:hypothetical protein